MTAKKQITKKATPEMVLECITIGKVSSGVNKDGDLEVTVPIKFKTNRQSGSVMADLANMQVSPTILKAKIFKMQSDLLEKKIKPKKEPVQKAKPDKKGKE